MRDPRTFLPPMLAVTAAHPFDGSDWRFELKWDGFRALVSAVDGLTVWSRKGHPLLSRYPALGSLASAIRRPAVLDGELVAIRAGDVSFHALQDSAPTVALVVFDCLYDNDGWLLDKPLTERLDRLRRVVSPGTLIWMAPGIEGAAGPLLDLARARQMEGVMAKRLDSPYRPGVRDARWQKFLVHRRATVWAVAAEETRTGFSLLLAEDTERGRRPVGRVAVRRLPANWGHAKPGAWGTAIPVHVRYRSRGSDGRLRHAAFVGYADEP